MDKKIISKKDVGFDTQTTIHLSKRDKSNITYPDIEAIVNQVEDQGGKVLVRGLNIEHWFCLKKFGEDLNTDYLGDYYRNRIKPEDVSKFCTFAQLEITVLKPKN
jgi:hypothetical protein